MTKAAASLGIVILLAATAIAQTQPAAVDDAINVAVRRQADQITLHQKVADAREAMARHDLVAAAKLYDQSVELAVKIGPKAGPDGVEAVQGLVTVRLELAEQARKRGDYQEVETQLARVLKVDSQNPVAIAAKAVNDRTLAERRGLDPSPAALEQVAGAKKEKVDANTLVQDGRVLLEAGKLDAADAKLNAALKLDPSNRGAFYYKELVKEYRYQVSQNKQNQDSRKAMLEVADAWERPTKGGLLPVPNPYNGTNTIYTGKGRQAIVHKLNTIKFDTVQYDGLPLSEVIRLLSEEARKRDPEKKGINFIINPNAPAAGAGAPVAIDPATGLQVAAPPTEAVDVGAISIKLNYPLTDIRFGDVLNAVEQVAEKPIKFSIQDFAVVVSLKGQEITPMAMRIFNVDPNTFQQGLQGVGGASFGDIQTSSGGGGGGSSGGGGGGSSGGGGQGGGQGGSSTLFIPRVSVAGGSAQGGGGGQGGGQGGGGSTGGGIAGLTTTNAMESVSAAVQNFFSTMNIDLRTPPKSVFWNDRRGQLIVYATMEDLDRIEQVIQVLNVAPPQVNIKVKFTEITQSDTRALGFDWFLGNLLMGNRNGTGLQAGSAPSYVGVPSVANPEGSFPGSFVNGTSIPASGSDALLTGGLRNAANAPALATFTGILTDPQFRVVIKAIDQRSGVDLLSEGDVTTLSGRQCQIQTTELRTIVTGTSQNTGGQSGSTGNTGTGNTTLPNQAVFATPLTQIMPFGPTIDVVPYVSSDGCTIQMTIIPTLSEFAGYDDPGPFVPTAVTGGGVPITSVLPLPKFRLRQVTTSCIVWDGQTVVLGGLIISEITKTKDKVPILGDLPFVGKLFRSESSVNNKKNLVIFVTPTIIDPAGNRAHAEDELPFAQQPGRVAIEASAK